jgi:hypothetical protein
VPYVVTGTTRDDAGAPLAACDVYLLKFNSGTDTFTQVDSDVSDGSGLFSLDAADNDAAYTVLAFKAGSPVTAGITRRDLVPDSTGGGGGLDFSDPDNSQYIPVI